MIQIGSTLPSCTLMEYLDTPTEGCSLGPNPVVLPDALQGKTIALFAVPGAFTPTCSEKHLPGYIQSAQALRDAGVDEIWCLAVNDAFVMGAWGREQQATGTVRMIADGDAVFSKATGLTLDLSGKGLGLRAARYSMLVKDGKVQHLNVEAPGKFEVSDAATLLAQLRA